ncbi:hypothetical protein TWF281_006978 [Arthrobotrys megalospora]
MVPNPFDQCQYGLALPYTADNACLDEAEGFPQFPGSEFGQENDTLEPVHMLPMMEPSYSFYPTGMEIVGDSFDFPLATPCDGSNMPCHTSDMNLDSTCQEIDMLFDFEDPYIHTFVNEMFGSLGVGVPAGRVTEIEVGEEESGNLGSEETSNEKPDTPTVSPNSLVISKHPKKTKRGKKAEYSGYIQNFPTIQREQVGLTETAREQTKERRTTSGDQQAACTAVWRISPKAPQGRPKTEQEKMNKKAMTGKVCLRCIWSKKKVT